MTAATARDQLEALIWRTLPGIAPDHVDALLHAADRYAAAAADEVLGTADGRDRLLQAADELSDRRLVIHFKGIAGVTACRATWNEPYNHEPHPARITTDVHRVTCRPCKRSRGYKDQAAAA